MSAGFLVEVESALQPRNWVGQSAIFADSLTVFANDVSITPASSAGLYSTELSRRVLLIVAVTEDGLALAEHASVAAVGADAGSWYWDSATHRLWVHTTDDGPALSKRILATALDGFKLGNGPSVFLRNGVPIAYEGRILTLPAIDLRQQTESNEPALGAVVSLGDLTLANHDGLAEEWQAERMIAGRAARSYYGELGDPSTIADTDVATLTTWFSALVDSLASTPEECRLTLMPRARTLAAPALTTTFTLATYPGMDPEIAGLPIPRVYGRVRRAEAFRIDSGRWKVTDHAIGDIYAVFTADDATAVPGLGVDLALGEFLVAAAYDIEPRLYVELDGTVSDDGAPLPGALLRRLMLDLTDFTEADIDTEALAALDTVRPVFVGFQLTDGTVREALDRVARSAFCDWFLTRQGLFSARARIRGGGNLVSNPSFEVDTEGWRPMIPAESELTRVTSGFSAPDGAWIATMAGLVPGVGWAVSTWLPAALDADLTVTALLSAKPSTNAPNAPGALQASLVDVFGTVLATSDPQSVPSGIWTRVHWRPGATALAAARVATAASEDIFADDATFPTTGLAANVAGTVDLRFAGTDLAGNPLGPDSGLYVDGVTAVPAIQADDTNAEAGIIAPEVLIVWEVSVPYRVDQRAPDKSPRVTVQSVAARDLYPLAVSVVIDADCVDAASAQVVAEAYLEWYRSTRARTSMQFFAWTQIEPGDVIDAWHLSRTLRPPLASRFYTVVSVREAAPGQGGQYPTIDVDATLHYDPAVGPLVFA